MESEACVMLKEYDFSSARKNPYAKALKKQITINIDSNTIDYFKEQAEVVGIPYQTLINLYLKDCVANNRHLGGRACPPAGIRLPRLRWPTVRRCRVRRQ